MKKKYIKIILLSLAIGFSLIFSACYFINVPTYLSADAFHPAKTQPLTGNPITGLATDGVMTVAVTLSGEIAWSNDHGVTWELASFKTKNIADGRSFNSVAYGEGYFFAGGNSAKAAWSCDGKVWSDGVIGPMNPENILDVAAGKLKQQTVFVAVGTRGRIAYATISPEGPWTQVSSSPFGDNLANSGEPVDTVFAVTYGSVKGAGIFVAAGTNGNIAVMNNFSGKLYGPVAAGTRNTFRALTFGDERFVAVGEGATLMVSPDPDTYAWNKIQERSFMMQPFVNVIYAPAFNYFILQDQESILRFSEKCENWSASNFRSLFPSGISAMAGTNKKIILADAGGRIFYSN